MATSGHSLKSKEIDLVATTEYVFVCKLSKRRQTGKGKGVNIQRFILTLENHDNGIQASINRLIKDSNWHVRSIEGSRFHPSSVDITILIPFDGTKPGNVPKQFERCITNTLKRNKMSKFEITLVETRGYETADNKPSAEPRLMDVQNPSSGPIEMDVLKDEAKEMQEKQRGTLTFKLCIPNGVTNRVEKVKLLLSNNREYILEKQDQADIYETKIFLPVGKYTYKYVVKLGRQVLRVIRYNSEVKEQIDREISDETTYRDVLCIDEMPDVCTCVAHHILDIINPLEDVLFDLDKIEKFLSIIRKTNGFNDDSKLVKSVLDQLNDSPDRYAPLPNYCAVLMIFCCKYNVKVNTAEEKSDIQRSSIDLIAGLDVVPKRHYSIFNEHSEILFQIYRTAHPGKLSIVDFVQFSWKFLTTNTILKVLSGNKELFSWEENVSKIKNILAVCTRDLKSGEKEDSCVTSVIGLIFERIYDPQNILEVLSFLRTKIKHNPSLLAELGQTTITRCTSFFQNAAKMLNWKRIEEVASKIKCSVAPEIVACLEETICDSLLNLSPSGLDEHIRYDNDFIQMIDTCMRSSYLPILQNEESQQKYLETIKQSTLHQELFRIFMDSGPSILVGNSTMTRYLNEWFNGACNFFRKSDAKRRDFVYLFRSIETATKVTSVKSIDHIHEALTEILTDVTFDQYLEIIEDVDNMFERVKEIYVCHFKRFISKQSEEEIRRTINIWKQKTCTRLHGRCLDVVISFSLKLDEYGGKRNPSFLTKLKQWIFLAQSNGWIEDIVKKNSTFIRFCTCIKDMYKKLKDDRFNIQIIDEVKSRSTDLIQAIHFITGERIRHITEVLERSFQAITQTLDKIQCTMSVIRIIETSTDFGHFHGCFGEECINLAKTMDGLRKSEISFYQYKTSCKPIHRLLEVCCQLSPYMQDANKAYKPNIFWAINREYLSQLKGTRKHDHMTAYEFIVILNSTCRNKYDTFMKGLFDSSALLHVALPILSAITSDEFTLECEIYKKCSRPDSRISNLKVFKLFDLQPLIRKINSIRSFSKVFDLDIDAETIGNFQWVERVAGGNVEKPEGTILSFLTMVDSLEEEHLNFEDNFCELLSVIGQSADLVAFLREIKNEDIRYLLDAVEGEYFDKYIPVVSHLIEIKDLLLPLVEDKSTSIDHYVLLLRGSLKELKIQKASEKCQKCSEDCVTLKEFYKAFTNRTERTIDKIQSITEESTVSFRLKDRFCEYSIICKQNPIETQPVHGIAELNDLRSRTLLIQSRFEKYAEVPQFTERFHTFLEIVDKVACISNAYVQLRMLGHPLYLEVEEEIDTSIPSLSEKLITLQAYHSYWEKCLMECRETCEVVNFIKSDQLPILYRFLFTGLDKDKFLAVIDFVNPDMKKQLLESRRPPQEWEASKFRQEPSNALIPIKSNLENIYKKTKRIFQTTDTCLVGIGRDHQIRGRSLLFIRLEKDSMAVIPTVLSLFHELQERLPLANEIILCNEKTSWEEIRLLLRRWKMTKTHLSPLYCIAFTEYLAVEIQYSLARELGKCDLTNESTLSIVYRGNETDTFVAIFSEYEVRSEPLLTKELIELFHAKFPCTMVYKSQLPGQGKTESIYEHAASVNCRVKTVHISGPVDRNAIVCLLNRKQIKKYHCLHLDIGIVDRPHEIDTIIFELVVLGYLNSEANCFSLGCREIAIEIACTVNDILFRDLPLTSCFQTRNLIWREFVDFRILKSKASMTRVVCSYLDQLDRNELRNDLCIDDEVHISDKTCRVLLQKYFKATEKPSFSQIQIFLSVLALQLKKMSASSFFRISHLESMTEDASDLKRQFIETMIKFANEFATRSVLRCRTSQEDNMKKFGLHGDEETIVTSLVSRTSGMIRWDSSNHLVLVFHGDFQTLSALYRNVKEVPGNIETLFSKQIGKDLKDFSMMEPSDLLQILIRIARTSKDSVTSNEEKDFLNSYALTPDNLLKMVLILIRMQAHVPVVIMGETGCGKTSLIQKLAKISGINLFVYPIHAGLSEKMIEERVNEINENAKSDYNTSVWLFLDEINTSEHIGLLSSIVCHHELQGRILAPNLHILSACNPYRLKTQQTRTIAGLKGKFKIDQLSSLAYRVHPLPESLLDYVWDYGSLPSKEEKTYIKRMISNLDDFSDTKDVFRALLTRSQEYVREREKSSCTVSLRDVERCKRLVVWFYNDFLDSLIEKQFDDSKDKQIYCIILALTVCYQCRFSDNDTRKGYRDRLSSTFTECSIQLKSDMIHHVTKHVQEKILEKMDLPYGVARNASLKENVFLLLTCILNKIPLFIVGKPGCSKSLSMQLIRSNLNGPDSKSPFFRAYPRLYYTSYQGSESSTSEGILKVFERARKYNTKEENVLSLVILDEVGLAEISRFNPLKVLHTLLEHDGHTPDVAVVGISNWSLDAAKMNRAIHLSRPDMNKHELLETAEAINKSISRDKDTSSPRNTLEAMVDTYAKYTENQPLNHFHGLRDFYSFVKFYSREMTNVTGHDPVNEKRILWNGIRRNFGGIKEHTNIATVFFKSRMKIDENFHTSEDQLIRENIRDTHSRHLMLIINGDSAIGQLNAILEAEKREGHFMLGSQFEEDQSDDYNYRTLSKIILCMEQPNVLILKDLENIYGSLYDMLNQNYTIVQNKKHCRVALGPYSNPTCEVHDKFRCIVLVDVKDLDITDPPFLNRFEKQELSLADTLGNIDDTMSKSLEKFIRDISCVSGRFSEKDAFPVFGAEFVVSLITSIKTSTKGLQEINLWFRAIIEILWIIRPDAMIRIEDSQLCESNRSVHSLFNLYFMLPVHNGLGHYLNEVCNKHKNSSFFTDRGVPADMQDLIAYYLPLAEWDDLNDENEVNDSSTMDLENSHSWPTPIPPLDSLSSTSSKSALGKNLIVFTYSTIFVDVGAAINDIPHRLLKLGEIKSEKHLCDQLDQYWKDKHQHFLIIQCDARLDLRHILFVKTSVESSQKMCRDVDLRAKKNVCLLIHISRSIDAGKLFGKVNFLSGWPMAMIDSVERQNISLADFHEKTLFEALPERKMLIEVICREFPNALSTIRHSETSLFGQDMLRTMRNISSATVFLDAMADMIYDWIQQDIEIVDSGQWQRKAAHDKHLIFLSTTMIGSLNMYISNVIRQLLSMTLFKLDETNTLHSSLNIREAESKKKAFFLLLLRQKQFFDIHTVPKPSGPGCYVVSSRQLSLKVPFIWVYFETLAKYRGKILDDLRKLNVVPQFLSDKDKQSDVSNIVDSVMKLYVPLFEKEIYLIEKDAYPCLFKECLDDFCSFLSSEYPSRLSSLQRIEITKWVITKSVNLPEINDRSFASYIVSLFIWGWLFASRIFSVLQLFDLAPEKYESAITKLQSSSTTQSFTKDIEVLLEDICYTILPNENFLKSISIQQWHDKIYSCIASLSLMGIASRNFYILKLFSDLVAYFFIPYDISTTELCSLADVVSKNGLADRMVFQTLCSCLRMKKGEVSDEVLQSVFCMFLSRTLESNSNEGMMYALEEIAKGNAFQKDMLSFGICLQVRLCDYTFYSKDKEMKMLYHIISNEQTALGDDPFLTLLDKIITTETSQSFTVLTMDLLEKFIYANLVTVESITDISSHDNTILQKLLIAKVNLKENRGNLQFICSLSFVKVFIRAFVHVKTILRKTHSNIVFNALDELFSGFGDQEEHNDKSKDGKSYGALLFNFFYNTLYLTDGIFTIYRFKNVLPNPACMYRFGIRKETLAHQPMIYELFETTDYGMNQVSVSNNIKDFKSSLHSSVGFNDRVGLLRIAAVLQQRLLIKSFHPGHTITEEDQEYSESALKIANTFASDEEIRKMFSLMSMDYQELSRHIRCRNLTTVQTMFLCNWYCLNVCFSSNKSAFRGRIQVSNLAIGSLECQTFRVLSHNCTCGFKTMTVNDAYEECIMCHAKVSTNKVDEQQVNILSSDRSNIFFDLLNHATRICFSAEITDMTNMKDESERAYPMLWDQLTKELGVGSPELLSILMIFVRSNKDIFTCDPMQFSKWSEKHRKSLNDILRHRFQSLKENFQRITKKYHLDECLAYPKSLEDEKETILFASVGTATFESFQLEISLIEDETKYSFLRMFCKHLTDIKLPKHLLGLLSWHKIIMSKCRYKIKKIECRSMSVKKFIQQQPKKYHTELRNTFNDFRRAWNEIIHHLEILRKANPDIDQTKLEVISDEDVLDCCIIHDIESPLYKIIEALVLLQNGFIEKAMLLAAKSESYSSLLFMKKHTKTASSEIVSVMDLRERHLIHYDQKKLDSLLVLSQCGTTADTRRSVLYDFHAIEADLAHMLLHGKPLIDVKNSIILVEFKDDLYGQCVQLLEKISERISQKEISDELVSRVKEKCNQDPTVIPELLRLFGTIAILLERGIQCQETTPVHTFLENYVGDILQTDYGRVLPWHEYELTISHVVSFYMLLEKLNGESFVESLDEEFKTPLPESDRDILLKNVCSNRHLTELYSDSLKLFLHRFLYIRENHIAGDQSLSDHMEDPILWKRKLDIGRRKLVLGPNEEYAFDDIMPDSLYIEHIYSIMDLLRRTLEEFEEQTPLPPLRNNEQLNNLRALRSM